MSNGTGRPTLAAAEKRSHAVKVTFTAAELVELKRHAGWTPPAIVLRELTLAWMRREDADQ